MNKNYDTNEIIETYKELVKKFDIIKDLIVKDIISEFTTQQINSFEIIPRIKSLEDILKEIYKKECYEKPFNEIKDIVSVKIITYYERDIPKVCEIIEKEFNIIEKIERVWWTAQFLHRLNIKIIKFFQIFSISIDCFNTRFLCLSYTIPYFFVKRFPDIIH